MRGKTARGLASVAAATAISAVAFIGPSTASAACTGANIEGNGSSLQANAQQKYWSLPFNAKCSSTNEQVTYASTSSGKGLESWWVGHETSKYKGFGASNAFVGTDQPPNAKQEGEILEKGPGAKVLSIPVLQAAIALPIRLPEGCTATSGKKKKAFGRLTLSDTTLQAIFAHTITNWTQVATYNSDALHGTCSAPIVRIVRTEGSGTTAILKKFLYEINKGAVSGSENWNELAEKNKNLNWPDEEAAVLKRAEKGSGVTSLVASTPGSIGYANLNEVRENTAFVPPPGGTGGSGTSTFWPALQSKGKKFEDPALNGESDAADAANCAGEDYISLNGTGKQAKFPPSSVEDTWNEVTADTVQKKSYPLCGFTYDLALTAYEPFSEVEHPTSAAEVETIKNYLTYVLGAGQAALPGHDFLGLPTGKKGAEVLAIAQAGLAKIKYP